MNTNWLGHTDRSTRVAGKKLEVKSPEVEKKKWISISTDLKMTLRGRRKKDLKERFWSGTQMGVHADLNHCVPRCDVCLIQ